MPKYLTLTFLLLALLASANGIPAQDQTKETQAIDLLVRSASAAGIAPASIRTLVASGTYTLLGDSTSASYPFRVTAAGRDKVRWEIDTPEGTETCIVSGHGGNFQAKGQSKALSISRAMGRKLELLPVMVLAQWLNASDTSVLYRGETYLEGKKLQQISYQENPPATADPILQSVIKRITRVDLYLDDSTGLPAWLRYYEHPGDWRVDVAVDLIFSEFHSIGGVLMPLKAARFIGASKIGEVQFDSVRINVAVADNIFEE